MSQQLGGAKGGGSQSAARLPVIQADTIRSKAMVEVIEAWGWGEIYGFATTDPLMSIKLDGTPIKAPNGTLNFQGISVDYRYGTQAQAYIKGTLEDAIGSPISVNVPVVHATPVIKTVNDATTDAIRIIITYAALVSQNMTTGDRSSVNVELTIEVKPLGASSWSLVDLKGRGRIYDKIESTYQRAFTVNLKAVDELATSYDIRVTRVSADPVSNSTVSEQSAFTWDSYVKLTYAKLRRPNVPHIRLLFDARYFSSVPVRSYDLKGMLIQVPPASVYDPVNRIYTGETWDGGTLVMRWSRNPAWFLYHILTTGGIGLGSEINQAYQDKWSIFTIAKRCDETVPDGAGGVEPRYSIDAQFMAQVSAHEMINQLAGTFDAMPLWDGHSVYLTQDAPKAVSALYTPANVVGGRFVYQGSARQTRYTAAMIQYNDLTDQSRIATEYVEDFTAIERYGYRPITEAAIGCTSRAQAHRRGKRLLISGRDEIDAVTFSVGLSGINCKPGDIIRIADPLKSAGKRMGGRLSVGSTTTSINLDSAVILASAVSYRLAIIGNDGVVTDSAITTAAGTVSTLTVSPAFSAAPETELEFIVYSPAESYKLFRLLSVTENEDAAQGIYTLSATQYSSTKFADIDSIADLTPLPANPYQVTTVAPPSGILVNEGVYTGLEGLTRYLDISWSASNDMLLRGYHLIYRHNGATLFDSEVTGQTYRIINPLMGTYEITISAINITGKYSTSVTISHVMGELYPIASVHVTNLALKTTGTSFVGKQAELVWDTDALTVLGFSTTIATGVGGQSPWFRDFQVDIYDGATLLRSDYVTESAYNYSYDKNIQDGGPRRTVTALVRARDSYGRYSNSASLTVSNPAPAAILGSSVHIYAGYQSLILSYARPADNDWLGVIVFLSTTSGFTPNATNQVYIGADLSIVLTGLVINTPYFLRIAAYDAFGSATDYVLTTIEFTRTISSVADVPTPYAIKTGLQAALDDPTAKPLVFDADIFAININGTDKKTPFIVGNIAGVPSILMDANVGITGYLSASQIKSGTIGATEAITIGNGSIVIDGGDTVDGSIIVYEGNDTLVNRDFALLSSGNLVFQKYRGGAYQLYKNVNRVEYGSGIASGATVTLPGYWDSQPYIQVSLDYLKSYLASSSPSDQSWQVRADNLSETPLGSKQWKFDAVAQLTLSNAIGSTTAASASGINATGSFTSAESILVTNTVSVTVSAQFSSIRGNGTTTLGYLYRTVTWTVQGYNASTALWETLGTKVRNITSAEHGVTITDSNAVNLTGAYTKIRLTFAATDTNGNSYRVGNNTYLFQQTTVLSNAASVQALVSNSHPNDSPRTLTSAAAPTVAGYSIYQINYGASYAYTFNSMTATGFSNSNYISVTKTAVSPPSSGSGTVSTGNLTATSFSTTFWQVNVSGTLLSIGSYAGFTLSNPTATVYWRKLNLNSIVQDNTFNFASYTWAISGSTVLATGSLNYIAVGQ